MSLTGPLVVVHTIVADPLDDVESHVVKAFVVNAHDAAYYLKVIFCGISATTFPLNYAGWRSLKNAGCMLSLISVNHVISNSGSSDWQLFNQFNRI